ADFLPRSNDVTSFLCSRKSADFLPRRSHVTSFLCSRKSADFLPRAPRPGPRGVKSRISLPTYPQPLRHGVSGGGGSWWFVRSRVVGMGRPVRQRRRVVGNEIEVLTTRGPGRVA